MRIKLTHYVLSIIVLLSPFSTWGSGIGLFGLENALERNFEPIKTYSVPDEYKELIDGIAFCESSDRADVWIVDTNGYISRGVMQFQHQTFTHYTRRYGLLEHVEDEELKNWTFDKDYSKYLAFRMIQEDPNNLGHWKNCASASGAHAKVVKIESNT